MTKRERAQVVELLRCVHGTPLTLHETAVEIDADGLALRRANDAFIAVTCEIQDSESWPGGDEGYDLACLEAAARVEEGSWP